MSFYYFSGVRGVNSKTIKTVSIVGIEPIPLLNKPPYSKFFLGGRKSGLYAILNNLSFLPHSCSFAFSYTLMISPGHVGMVINRKRKKMSKIEAEKEIIA